jgi:hypothetical protein
MWNDLVGVGGAGKGGGGLRPTLATHRYRRDRRISECVPKHQQEEICADVLGIVSFEELLLDGPPRSETGKTYANREYPFHPEIVPS